MQSARTAFATPAAYCPQRCSQLLTLWLDTAINTLMTGLAKAPVFAAAIALVGCYQGFLVRDGADSVGRHTTTSVVQAIVWVIVIDAAFSVVYSKLGI